MVGLCGSLNRGRRHLFTARLVFFACCIYATGLLWCHAADAQENRALALDGKGAHAVLPAEIFAGLDESTVEMWAYWSELKYYAQLFAFGSVWQSVGVNHWENTPALQFFIYDKNRDLHLVRSKYLYDYQNSQPFIRATDGLGDLFTGRWHHIAAVAGKGGMRLYLDGVLVAQNAYRGSFSEVEGGAGNFLGRSPWESNAYFSGMIDEVRVWDTARTPQELRAHMHRRLSGVEQGLVGLWNFDAGDGRDLSRQAYHATLVGGAHSVSAMWPEAGEHALPIVLHGSATGPDGKKVQGAEVVLERSGRVLSRTWTDRDGRYTLVADVERGVGIAATYRDLGVWVDSLSLRKGSRMRLDLQLHPAEDISGQLMSWDQLQRHADVLVEAESAEETGRVYRVFSDRAGRYRFVNLKPGRYRVRALVPGGPFYYGDSAGGRELEVGPNPQRGIDLYLAPFKKGVWREHTVLEGLAGNAVTSLARSGSGELWIGTQEGLSRFDGANFSRYGKAEGLSNIHVTSLAVGEGDVLWVGTEGGLLRFYGTHFRQYGKAEGLLDARVRSLMISAEGELWVGTDGGVARFDGAEFTHYDRANGLPDNRVLALYQGDDGLIWVGTHTSRAEYSTSRSDVNAGLAHFDGIGFVAHPVASLLASDNTVLSMTRDGRGGFWLGFMHGGLVHFDGSAFAKPHTPDYLPDWVSALYLDDRGVLWAGAQDGLWRYDGLNWAKYESEVGVLQHSITALHGDGSGGLWVGTEGGIAHYESRVFANFTTADGMSENGVQSLYIKRSGEFLLGTTAPGILRFGGGEWGEFEPFNGLPNDLFDAFYEDEQEGIWLAAQGGGLVYSGPQGLKRYTQKDGLVDNAIRALAAADNGGIWIGTARGLSHFADGVFRSFGLPDELVDAPIEVLYEDGTGVLWLGTHKGLLRYDGEFRLYAMDDGLVDSRVYSLVPSQKKGLWIGTGGGLAHFADGVFRTVREEHGLVDGQVEALYEDGEGILWLGMRSGGVVLYDGVSWSSLDTRDGLAGNRVSTIDKHPDGAMFFGTDNGLTRYRRSEQKPVVRIVGLQADRSYEEGEPFTTGHRLTVNFAAIDFKTVPEKRLYRCRLEGIDEDWRPPTHQPFFEWTPQQSGIYTFVVQAIDRDLNYSEPASLQLVVESPWYQNIWIVLPAAMGVLFSLAISVIFSTRYYAERRRSAHALRRSHDELEQQVRARTRDLEAEINERKRAEEQLMVSLGEKEVLLKEIHHRVKNNLQVVSSLISLQASDIKEVRIKELFDDSHRRIQSMALIHEQLYQTTDLSSIDLRIYISQLVNDLFEAYEQGNRGVALDVQVAAVRVDVDTAIPCGLIINELVSNAFKYAFVAGGSGLLEVVLEREESGFFVLSVRDDGVGMEADLDLRRIRSLGLQLVHTLTRQLQGELHYESAPGEGTRFVVRWHSERNKVKLV